MYWNNINANDLRLALMLNSNIRCIEISRIVAADQLLDLLNSNIRCIEIGLILFRQYCHLGWIVTLDVLKCICDNIVYAIIVTLDVLKCTAFEALTHSSLCWIVTLDVLKCGNACHWYNSCMLNSNIRCIEIYVLCWPTANYRVE